MTARGKPATRRPQRDETVDVLIIGAARLDQSRPSIFQPRASRS